MSAVSRLKDRQLLGVAQTASKKEIKRRYIELCKKYHPDVAHQQQDATVDIRDITAAYQRLIGKESYFASNRAPEGAAWEDRPPEARRGSSPEEQQQWTKWSLLTGIAMVTTIVAYSKFEPQKNVIVDLNNTKYHSAWQQQQQLQYELQHEQQSESNNNTSYRQWRKG
ncbi:hypothetical protein BDA99DRAFT_536088 [Phascolomyces articulosus]|uniref:J domain-containing protein n=1 Tax=Phascolomyces articulosus TaxID=60185 RepID=A0AAD5K323_9FUNG|nr:hypothetical protein BDA99DRAFT_536088 [Phascolomyces articulosus]